MIILHHNVNQHIITRPKRWIWLVDVSFKRAVTKCFTIWCYCVLERNHRYFIGHFNSLKQWLTVWHLIDSIDMLYNTRKMDYRYVFSKKAWVQIWSILNLIDIYVYFRKLPILIEYSNHDIAFEYSLPSLNKMALNRTPEW